MPLCKKCILHILSNLMLAAIVYTLAALVLQINSGTDIKYQLLAFTLIAILIKSWADKTLNDLKK